MRIYKYFFSILMLLSILPLSGCSKNTITHFPKFFEEVYQNEKHTETEWKISDAVAYDAICFINVLTGDPFYTSFHKADYLHFKALMTDKELRAIDALNTFRSNTGERLANLLIGFVHGLELPNDLKGVAEAIKNPSYMKKSFLEYPFNSEEQLTLYFEPIKDDIIMILEFLISNDFEGYWSANKKSEIDARVEEMKRLSGAFNPIPFLEKKLGWQYHTDTVEVYVMAFANPTAFHFGYTGFITDKTWPAENLYLATIHELMHPSVNMNDFDVAEAILAISNNPFVLETYNNRDPIYGYNNIFLYIEENIIQAMDRQFTPYLGIESRSLKDWVIKDEGMHRLGMAIYMLMEEDGFLESDETIQDFLVRHWKKGSFKPGQIEKRFNDFVIINN